ncbi:MAG: hypothetical protein EOP06_16405 [Proteobacteria bacterium]|nr:MAG: hypothetical protein EOP06_16405 [Pseudomonadota bacterium]
MDKNERMSAFLRARTIDRWARLLEENAEQAAERREIERELEMTSQDVYQTAVQQAIERIDIPPRKLDEGIELYQSWLPDKERICIAREIGFTEELNNAARTDP